MLNVGGSFVVPMSIPAWKAPPLPERSPCAFPSGRVPPAFSAQSKRSPPPKPMGRHGRKRAAEGGIGGGGRTGGRQRGRAGGKGERREEEAEEEEEEGKRGEERKSTFFLLFHQNFGLAPPLKRTRRDRERKPAGSDAPGPRQDTRGARRTRFRENLRPRRAPLRPPLVVWGRVASVVGALPRAAAGPPGALPPGPRHSEGPAGDGRRARRQYLVRSGLARSGTSPEASLLPVPASR